MASDYIIVIDGIHGETKQVGFDNGIEVESFSWGLTQPGSFASQSGGGTGKSSFADLNFMSYVGKQSPELSLSSATGKHITKATLTLRKAGGKGEIFYKVILEDIMVSSYSSNGSSGSNSLPMDAVSLNFAKIEYDYFVQDGTGKIQGGPVVMKYDLKKGTAG